MHIGKAFLQAVVASSNCVAPTVCVGLVLVGGNKMKFILLINVIMPTVNFNFNIY